MRLWSKFSVPITILIVLILAGTLIYQQVEGWRYLDSLYFTVVTITTIGYGDFAPQTDTGKIVTIIFPFLGIGLVLYLFSLTSRLMFSKHLRGKLKDAGRLNGKRGVRRIKK